MGNSTVYTYNRSKCVLQEEGERELFMYAGLSVTTTSTIEPEKLQLTVCPGEAELIEIDMTMADPDYLDMPDHDLCAEINESKYIQLTRLAKVDRKAFLLYEPAIEEFVSMDFYIKPKPQSN